jgi:hypothetical protein
MADTVICTNDQCSQYQIPKDNSGGYDLAEAQCGACGEPVEEAPAP